MNCFLCPRKCGIDRDNKKGFCSQKNVLKITNYSLHEWEEPCISYKKGSGAIFFSGCNLKCVYCQNYEISTLNVGQEITVNQLADIFKELDEKADNINLVNPTHFSSLIYEAVKIYKPKNPIIYNTHGYELESEIEKVSKFVDIFLTDLKYYSKELSLKYSQVPNYFEVASKALNKMLLLKPNKFDNGKMLQGVIVRHLILPNCYQDSKKILEYLSKHHKDITLSLMSQYIPCGKASEFNEINRKITQDEYDKIIEYAIKLGLDGYMQEISSADTCFIPKFSNKVI